MTNDEMTKALSDVRDELVRRDVHRQLPESPAESRTAAGLSGKPTREADKMAGAVQALGLLLDTLDSWIQGVRENHDALGHRGESIGEECWRSFAPADIRSMVNDVARELGISEFPLPEKPKEDEVR